MAVTRKGKGPTAKVLKEMKDVFLEQVGDLWQKNMKDAVAIIEESETPKIRVNFGVTLDFSESTAQMKTSIQFTKSFTDERVKDFEDPDQMPLPDIGDSKKPKGKDAAE